MILLNKTNEYYCTIIQRLCDLEKCKNNSVFTRVRLQGLHHYSVTKELLQYHKHNPLIAFLHVCIEYIDMQTTFIFCNTKPLNRPADTIPDTVAQTDNGISLPVGSFLFLQEESSMKVFFFKLPFLFSDLPYTQNLLYIKL